MPPLLPPPPLHRWKDFVFCCCQRWFSARPDSTTKCVSFVCSLSKLFSLATLFVKKLSRFSTVQILKSFSLFLFHLIKLRLPICVAVNICFKYPVSFTPHPNKLMFDKFWSNVFEHFSCHSFHKKNNHLVSVRLDFASSLLAGNEKWRKGWLQLTLPICTPYPPFLYGLFYTKYIFRVTWLDFGFWMVGRESRNLSRLKFQHKGCILNCPWREKVNIYVGPNSG